MARCSAVELSSLSSRRCSDASLPGAGRPAALSAGPGAPLLSPARGMASCPPAPPRAGLARLGTAGFHFLAPFLLFVDLLIQISDPVLRGQGKVFLDLLVHPPLKTFAHLVPDFAALIRAEFIHFLPDQIEVLPLLFRSRPGLNASACNCLTFSTWGSVRLRNAHTEPTTSKMIVTTPTVIFRLLMAHPFRRRGSTLSEVLYMPVKIEVIARPHRPPPGMKGLEVVRDRDRARCARGSV